MKTFSVPHLATLFRMECKPGVLTVLSCLVALQLGTCLSLGNVSVAIAACVSIASFMGRFS